MTSSASSDVLRIWRWSCNVRKCRWRSRSPTFIIIMSNLMSTYRVVGGQNGKGLIPTPFFYLYWLFTVTKKRCFPQFRVRRIGCLLWHRHDCFLSLVYEDVAELLFQFKLKIWSSPFYYSPNEKWRLNCSKVALHAPIFLRGKYVRFYDCMRFCHENAISAADCSARLRLTNLFRTKK